MVLHYKTLTKGNSTWYQKTLRSLVMFRPMILHFRDRYWLNVTCRLIINSREQEVACNVRLFVKKRVLFTTTIKEVSTCFRSKFYCSAVEKAKIIEPLVWGSWLVWHLNVFRFLLFFLWLVFIISFSLHFLHSLSKLFFDMYWVKDPLIL